MAWGTTGLTEDSELKRVAAVRQYLYEQFPSSTIRDSYDPGRLAQVFRVEITFPACNIYVSHLYGVFKGPSSK